MFHGDEVLELIINADVSIVNAIRRTAIGRVPSIAIDTVRIEENDNEILPDEFIAHRIGQIPLIVHSESKRFMVKLDEIGPKQIFSRDLIFMDDDDQVVDFIKPTSPDILIMDLAKGQRISLTGYTEEGIGSDHSKWDVCCGTGFELLDSKLSRYRLRIETNGSFTAKEVFHKSIEIIKSDLIAIKKMF